MDNEAMYNAFIKDRTEQTDADPSQVEAQAQPRVSAEDIPEFEIEVEEPGEGLVAVEEITDEPAMGVETSMDPVEEPVDHVSGNEEPSPVDAFDGFRAPDPVEGFDEYRTDPTAGFDPDDIQPVEEVNTFQEELEDFRRDPAAHRSASRVDIFDEENLLTVPPYEFEGDGAKLPPPEVFNAYPPEVQRKIMEWTDRDLKARRDDESRRQDAVLRANIARDRTRTAIPIFVIVLCILCAAITGVITQNALFVLAFLVVAVVYIGVLVVGRIESGRQDNTYRTYTKK